MSLDKIFYDKDAELSILDNEDQQKDVYTDPENIRLVYLNIDAKQNTSVTQNKGSSLIRVETGKGMIDVDNSKNYSLSSGSVIIIPPGLDYDIINRGRVPLKLMIAYTSGEIVTDLQRKDTKSERQQLIELQLWLDNLGKSVSIDEIKGLTKLNLKNKHLTSIPPEIGILQNLKDLRLHGNKLTRLPPEIGQLKNLQNLWLWDNELTELPVEISGLQNLEELWLYNNNLETLPVELSRLHNLKSLRINSSVKVPRNIDPKIVSIL